jgi:hypothetical protein
MKIKNEKFPPEADAPMAQKIKKSLDEALFNFYFLIFNCMAYFVQSLSA